MIVLIGKNKMNKNALLIVPILTLIFTASTEGFASEIPMYGSNPAIINKKNIENLENQNIEKKFIETTESDSKKIEKQEKRKKELKTKDVVKGNLTYNPKFTLNKVSFEGNTVISDRKLQKLAKKYIGQEIYLEDVLNLTVEVSRYYQQKGYLTSYAYLDSQEISDGKVVINIKESRVSKKESVGQYWEKESYLNNIVMSGKGLN